MKKAVIDIGTNSVKLTLGEPAAEGGARMICDMNVITKLGEGMRASGALSAEAMERTAQAVAKFAAFARAEGADEILCVGTMALRSRIQEGYTLSDSLREHPRVFDSLFCSMVAAGEKSGHLDVVLNRLADYTEQRQRLKSRLLQAMLYPLVLLVVATGVVTILLTAVVPKIIEQFDHLGHALPASTRTLIAMSDALQASGVYWLAGLLALLVLGQRLLKNPTMRLRWDKTLLRLPVIGRVARGLNTARFSRTLSILTASSVPLLEGIQTAAAVSANRYVEQQLLLAADRVREGSSLRAALAELRLFPPMMLYMIASGEQSGELETMLEQAAVNQEREFDTQVGLALGLFEPALVVMMAGVVLFIVIAILEPMLQLNNMVGM